MMKSGSPKSSPHTHAKAKVGGAVRLHPHTRKALQAVAVKKGIKHHSKGSTGNGVTTADTRY